MCDGQCAIYRMGLQCGEWNSWKLTVLEIFIYRGQSYSYLCQSSCLTVGDLLGTSCMHVMPLISLLTCLLCIAGIYSSWKVRFSYCWAAGLCANVSNLLLMKRHISGANLEGPYWQEFNFPPLQSIDQARVCIICPSSAHECRDISMLLHL